MGDVLFQAPPPKPSTGAHEGSPPAYQLGTVASAIVTRDPPRRLRVKRTPFPFGAETGRGATGTRKRFTQIPLKSTQLVASRRRRFARRRTTNRSHRWW